MLGDDFKRKGLSLLALILLVPVPSLAVAAAMIWHPEATWARVLFMLSKLWLVVFPICWHVLVDVNHLSGSPPLRGGLRVGAVLGVLLAGLVFAAYALACRWGWIDAAMVAERAARTGLDRKGVYIAGMIYWIAVNSVIEEYVWRWFVFRKFEGLFGGGVAVLFSALAFTAHHVLALAAQFDLRMTVVASIGVFVGGAIWSGLYLRYRSVWPGYISHALVDIPIFVIGWRLIFGA